MADSKFKNRTSPESDVRKAENGTRNTGHGGRRLAIEGTKGSGATISRPVLRGVKNPRDFNRVLFNLIHRDIG